MGFCVPGGAPHWAARFAPIVSKLTIMLTKAWSTEAAVCNSPFGDALCT